LTVKDIIIGDEDPHEFEALRAELELNFQPRTRFDMPGLDAALARARQEEVDNLLQSEMQAEADRACTCRLNEETRLRCEESFGNDDDSIYAATLNGTYASRFKTFLEEVKAEENKPDCDGSIPAQEMVHSNRGTGLPMLIQERRLNPTYQALLRKKRSR
jgi:hypothetical protein